jgi:hypothetical protein
MNHKKWFAGLAVSVLFLMPATGSASTMSELQAQIATLLAQIHALQAQLGTSSGGSSAGGVSSVASCVNPSTQPLFRTD